MSTGDDPTLNEAISSSVEKREMWRYAIDAEFESLDQMETWMRDDSPLPQPLTAHVVLKSKRLSNRKVGTFQCPVVARENLQVYGENYMETHAPFIPYTLLRTFLYLALTENISISQVGIKTAFLYEIIEKYILVPSPRGIPDRPPRTYKLVKAICGLKRAQLVWHKEPVPRLQEIRISRASECSMFILRRNTMLGKHISSCTG